MSAVSQRSVACMYHAAYTRRACSHMLLVVLLLFFRKQTSDTSVFFTVQASRAASENQRQQTQHVLSIETSSLLAHHFTAPTPIFCSNSSQLHFNIQHPLISHRPFDCHGAPSKASPPHFQHLLPSKTAAVPAPQWTSRQSQRSRLDVMARGHREGDALSAEHSAA